MNSDPLNMTDEERYGYEKQRLIDRFTTELKKVAEDAINDMYQDVAQWAPFDDATNYRNHLHEALSAEITSSILSSDGSIYSWAANYRKNLLRNHAAEIQSAMIGQLQAEIKHRDERISQLEERWRRDR